MPDHDNTRADSSFEGEDADLDDELVMRLVGKRLLVGLTYIKSNGALIEQNQLHGIVEQITRQEGIVVRRADGSKFRLPPDLSGIEEAPSGTYRLRATGEEVHNPDFLYTWTITCADE